MDERAATALLSFAREADDGLRGRDASRWRNSLEERLAECDAAFEWFLDQGRGGEALELAVALCAFARISGRTAAGRDRLTRAVSAASSDDARMPSALYENALLAFWQGEDEARSLLDRSLALARRQSDPTGIAVALCGLARLALRDGDLEGSRNLCDAALAVTDGTDDTLGRSNALHVLGVTAQMQGDLLRAREVMARRIELARSTGNVATVSTESSNLSMVERQLGNLERAEQLALEALELEYERGDDWAIPYALNGLAAVAVELGEFERAATLLGAAEALQERQGNTWPPDEAPHFERSRAATQSAVEAVLHKRLWSSGRALEPADAVRFAARHETVGTGWSGPRTPAPRSSAP